MKTRVIIGISFSVIATALLLPPLKDSRVAGLFYSAPPPPQPAKVPGLSYPATPPPQQTEVCSGAFSHQENKELGVGAFQGALSQSKIVRSGDDIYASFELKATVQEDKARLPLHIAIVLDRSGSMGDEQMNHAKEAAKGLIRRLTEEDQVSIIKYDDRADVLIPLTSLTAGNRISIERAIDRIHARGGTNLHGGLVMGRDELVRSLAQGNLNRVILVSDGLANIGVTHHPTLGAIAAGIAAQGVRVSTIGVGVNYDEDLMSILAEQGRGQYHYVKDSYALQSVFDKELQSMQATVATGVELVLEPLCGAQVKEVLGYPTTKEGDGLLVPLSDLAGGEKRKVVVRLKANASLREATDLLSATLRFKDPTTGKSQTINISLGASVTEDKAIADASANAEVMTKVIEAESALATQQAAAAYGRGELSVAQQIIMRGKFKAEFQAKKYNTNPLRAYEAYGNMEKAMLVDPFSESGKDAVKFNKANASELAR